MDADKQSGENDRTDGGKFAPGNRASPGRPRGSPNRSTTELKSAILQALDQAGGIEYLTRLANTDAKTFATLLLRLLPAAPADASGNEVLLIDHDPDL
jgi:hypothetical protein